MKLRVEVDKNEGCEMNSGVFFVSEASFDDAVFLEIEHFESFTANICSEVEVYIL